MERGSSENLSTDLSEDLIESGILEGSEERGREGRIVSSSVSSSRTSFTSLSQVDSDLALARALQQQENAYLLLHMGSEETEYEIVSAAEDYEYVNEGDEDQDPADLQSQIPPERLLLIGEEGDDDGHIDGSLFENDEAYAQALQDAEQRNATLYMMRRIGVDESDEEEDDESYGSQDVWQDVDPDNMSYEELVALGEAVGTHSKGLKPDVIASLPCNKFVSSSTNSEDPCVICRCEYEDGDTLSTLPCKHHYHTDCIKDWLQINKVCPMCSAEVTPSGKEN